MMKNKREFTAEHRRNLSISAKKHWRNRELRKLKGIERREFFEKHPAIKQRMIKKLKNKWTRAKREEWSEKTRMLYEEKPEILRKIRKKAIEFSKAHPNQNKLFGLKTWFHLLVDDEARKKIEKNWENPYKITIPSALGKVRSKYEKKVADFLSKLQDYGAEYETKRLYFEGYESNPDFFVTSRKDKDFMCIVEVYGSHYMAEKKKREKQYYYKKYHLPVIGITPAETYNLDYCLGREIEKMRQNKYAKLSYIKKFENPLHTIMKSRKYKELKKMLKEQPKLRKEAKKILKMIKEIKLKGKGENG